MTDKTDILGEFIEDFNNPITEKMGEYLFTLVLQRAKCIYAKSPDYIIELMRLWLFDTDSGEPLRYLAIYVIEEMKLFKLKNDLDILKRKDYLSVYDIKYIDDAIVKMIKC
jgi:hypothetical protein